jgi:hypothetical protein
MWRLWQDCVLDLSRWSNSQQERGVLVTQKIVANTIPFEVSIRNLDPERFQIAMGSLDEIIPPPTLQYYKNLSRLPTSLVEGLAHTPDVNQTGYGDFTRLLGQAFPTK